MSDFITISPCQQLVNIPWEVPGSKSWTYRHVIGAIVTGNRRIIKRAAISKDLMLLLKSFKIDHAIDQEYLTITPNNNTPEEINVGNSGLAMRLLLGYAASKSNPVVLDGDASIRQLRTIAPIVDILRQGGVNVEYLGKEGYGPVRITGPFRGGEYHLNVLDSQFASSLMLLGALTPAKTRIHLHQLHEWPWLKLNAKWLHAMGAKLSLTQTLIDCQPSQLLTTKQILTPCDWSSASFAIAACLMSRSAGEIHHLELPSCQGDSQIARWLLEKGLGKMQDGILHITPRPFSGSVLQMDPWIDAVPIMSVILTQAQTPSTLKDVAGSSTKECDRPVSIANMLERMGAHCEYNQSILIKPSQLTGTNLTLPHDHRMVLSAACAALSANEPTRIAPASSIDKTFPGFFTELTKRGVSIT